ncbi:phospho-sugar mutase [Paenibacillus sp. GCM10012307]|uniref:Phospho-sugar mutase n=1 Tax=Paenibacillus roseus TaxID=2798579 RepID=A0A934J3K0_9BACL|nr:phospho-sugar mutase [Paenibacillus roseus]MBJ6359795.1 phospho-sugar mutase [Paenibacillus roseus]
MNAIAEQLDHAIQIRYKRWKRARLPAYLRKELGELKAGEITDRFYKQLEFGTDGLREKIGAGTNRMNIFTVRRLAQALADEIREGGFAQAQRGVVIAFDNRVLSREFAEQAARVLAHNEIKVHLFSEARPTPELSFAIRWLHAAAGIMIAAGCSPYQYSGFRIFTEDGSVMQAEQAGKLSHRLDILEDDVGIPVMDSDEAVRMGRLIEVGSEVDEAYYGQVLEVFQPAHLKKKYISNLRIVYTPLHGSSGAVISRLLKTVGCKEVYCVNEQANPDPLFLTLKNPDPKEKDVYRHALIQADACDAELVLAVDPESQELGVLVRSGEGEYEQLTPHQLGSLLLDYIGMRRKLLKQRDIRHKQGEGIFYTTILTTNLSREIARKYGMAIEQTLPGFNYIAMRIAEQEHLGESSYLFAYDENGGFLPEVFVRDKDALQTLMLTVEMAAYYKGKKLSIWSQLNRLYRTFGYHLEDEIHMSYKGLEGWQRVRNTMARLRGEFPRQIGLLQVKQLTDYREGKEREAGRDGVFQTDLPRADMIRYVFDDGAWCVIRLSSASPTLKLFFGCRSETKESCQSRMSEIRSAMLYYLETIL